MTAPEPRHETRITFSRDKTVVRWKCTCGETGQSFKAQHESTVRLSAVYHERNNAVAAAAAAEPRRHMTMPNGWTLCNMGPSRRARRTRDGRRVTCPDCLAVAAAEDPGGRP